MLLNDQQLDVFRELINIGVGKSAALLNEMIESPIKLSIPKIWVKQADDLDSELSRREGTQYSTIKLNFEGSFSGVAEVVFPISSAENLVVLLTGEDKDSPGLNSLREGTLNEVANVLLNGVMGSIANILEDRFDFMTPTYQECSFHELIASESKKNAVFLVGEAHFIVKDHNIEGDIILVLEIPSFKNLQKGLDNLLE